jgi:antirestriction protein
LVLGFGFWFLVEGRGINLERGDIEESSYFFSFEFWFVDIFIEKVLEKERKIYIFPFRI